jgi:hemerythrin superfamily protein
MRRTIADQDEAELGGRGSVLVRQRRDHVDLDHLLDRCAATDGDEQLAVLNRIYRLVFPHAFAEEAVLWPALRRSVPDGEALTLRVEQEHQEINELVTRLERARPGDPGREALLDEVVDLLRQDVRDEEDLLLPRLQEHLDDAGLQRLGRSWELVRRIAPTRPHPVVSRRPPGNVLSALPLSLVDRTRDALDGAGRRWPRALGGAARVAGVALADVAGAIERLPGMRRGERPETRSGDDGAVA